MADRQLTEAQKTRIRQVIHSRVEAYLKNRDSEAEGIHQAIELVRDRIANLFALGFNASAARELLEGLDEVQVKAIEVKLKRAGGVKVKGDWWLAAFDMDSFLS